MGYFSLLLLNVVIKCNNLYFTKQCCLVEPQTAQSMTTLLLHHMISSLPLKIHQIILERNVCLNSAERIVSLIMTQSFLP